MNSSTALFNKVCCLVLLGPGTFGILALGSKHKPVFSSHSAAARLSRAPSVDFSSPASGTSKAGAGTSSPSRVNNPSSSLGEQEILTGAEEGTPSCPIISQAENYFSSAQLSDPVASNISSLDIRESRSRCSKVAFLEKQRVNMLFKLGSVLHSYSLLANSPDSSHDSTGGSSAFLLSTKQAITEQMGFLSKNSSDLEISRANLHLPLPSKEKN